MNKTTVITIVANLQQSTESATATKLGTNGKIVDLTIDEISTLKTQLIWLLDAKVVERAFNRIEPGKLYYHMRDHHYYKAKTENDLLVFDQSDKSGSMNGRTLTASQIHLPHLRLVAKQPELRIKQGEIHDH